MKLWKVVEELRQRGVEPTIIQTGQHTDLLRGTPADDALRPNVTLNLPGNNDPIKYSEACSYAVEHVVRTARYDVVVVQGDTASAHGCAVGANRAGVPVAHVEAGIRSGDECDPWPEEGFRVEIDRITQWQFYATSMNAVNVAFDERQRNFEGGAGKGGVMGNPGIDALYSHTRPVTLPQQVQDRVLVTLHRRESFGDPIREIIRGILHGATKYPQIEFWWPMHPNPEVRQAFRDVGEDPPPNLIVSEPMGMIPFARMLAASKAVISDSGGVQEESAALGIPCIVARTVTDRPESVEINLAKVVGKTSQGIQTGLEWALGFGARCTPSDCFGDGHAAPRIVNHLLSNS